MRHDVAQNAQMTLSVHRDFPRKMGQSRASSDMEKAHQRYSTSGVKASGLLVTTKFADGNTAPYFEHAAQPTFALAEVVCCMTSWQGVTGTLFLSGNSLFPRGVPAGCPCWGPAHPHPLAFPSVFWPQASYTKRANNALAFRIQFLRANPACGAAPSAQLQESHVTHQALL